MKLLRALDRTAWDRAFAAFYEISIKVCYSMKSGLTDHELQDIAMEAVEKTPDYIQEGKSFEECEKLVVTITKNLLRDRFRQLAAIKHGGGRVGSLDAMDNFDASDDEQKSADTILAAGDDNRIIAEALKKVKEPYQTVIRDHYLSGLTQQEVADKLNLKIGSIGVYAKRGLEFLKANLPPGFSL